MTLEEIITEEPSVGFLCEEGRKIAEDILNPEATLFPSDVLQARRWLYSHPTCRKYVPAFRPELLEELQEDTSWSYLHGFQ